MDAATDDWGIKVERVEVSLRLLLIILFFLPFQWILLTCVPPPPLAQVKDVRLPQSLQRAMAAEAEATREARAKVSLAHMCCIPMYAYVYQCGKGTHSMSLCKIIQIS